MLSGVLCGKARADTSARMGRGRLAALPLQQPSLLLQFPSTSPPITKQVSWRDLARNWASSYGANLIGALAFAAIVYAAGVRQSRRVFFSAVALKKTARLRCSGPSPPLALSRKKVGRPSA